MATRNCAACGAPMDARPTFGIEIDVCSRCGAVFLDPGEAETQGVDTGALFGTSATELGPSPRPCPAHRIPMRRYRVNGVRGPAEIERADCCGGVFLDAGEQSDLATAAAHASRLAHRAAPAPRPASAVPTASGAEVTTSSGAVFALPPAQGGVLGGVLRGVMASAGAPVNEPESVELDPREATGRRCPRCGGPYRADRTGGVEIDVCDRCGSLFFDAGELGARAIDTAALFGVGPEAARACGPSQLACPACREPMEINRVTTLAGVLEVERAPCCGGLFLDGGEEDAFARAAQAATHYEADRRFARDGVVTGEAAFNQALAANIDAVALPFIRERVDSAIVHMLRRRHRRRHRHHGFDDDFF